MTREEKWDLRWLSTARHFAQWSKDPSTQTGAVIVDQNNRLVSIGYNGLPQGVKDLPERLENRDLKYKIVVHCERNALIFARGSVQYCKLYTWPFMSCAPCASMMIQAGIVEVVAPFSDNPRWADDFKLSQMLFQEVGVKVKLLNIPTDCDPAP
jgi:dCMP deaminase